MLIIPVPLVNESPVHSLILDCRPSRWNLSLNCDLQNDDYVIIKEHVFDFVAEVRIMFKMEELRT